MNTNPEIILRDWCQRPSVLWDIKTTELVVHREWNILRRKFFWDFDDYSSAGIVLTQPEISGDKKPILPESRKPQIFLESPSGSINEFYNQNGLEFDTQNTPERKDKVVDALELLNNTPELMNSICLLVRTIGILKSNNRDSDVSYSHPKLPFSIFISLCDDRNPISAARVAESILHEAMHLKLSLLQKAVELLSSEKDIYFFAPWRQEMRPANGVLHGIFVFRAIFDYFLKIIETSSNRDIRDHAQKRVDDIRRDMSEVQNFYNSDALSPLGKQFAKSLLTIADS